MTEFHLSVIAAMLIVIAGGVFIIAAILDKIMLILNDRLKR